MVGESETRNFPCAGIAAPGEILTSHIRSIDAIARPIRYAGAVVPSQIAQLVHAKLSTFIPI